MVTASPHWQGWGSPVRNGVLIEINSEQFVYILGTDTTVTITSTTIANNQAEAGGGLFVFSGTVLLTNATVASKSYSLLPWSRTRL